MFVISYKEVVKLKFYGFVKAYQNNSGTFTTQYTALPVGSALDVDPFNSNTARNARFLFNEMENLNNTENCSSECTNPYFIGGLPSICNNAIYLIPGLPRGATVQWAISNETSTGLVSFQTPNPNPNPNHTTIIRNGTANGTFTLTANITGGCAGQPTSLSRTITAGIAPTDLSVMYMRNNNGFQNVIFPNPIHAVVYTQTGNFSMSAFTNLPGTNVFNWNIYTTGGYGFSNFNPLGASATFTLTGTNAPTIPLSVTLTNNQNGCSTSITKYIVVVASIPGGTMGSIVVSPNPASDNINVTFTDAADSTAARSVNNKTASGLRSFPSKGRTIVSLFDFNAATLVRQWVRNEVNGKQYNFNTAGLKKGLFVLQVDRDDETRTTKIIIE